MAERCGKVKEREKARLHQCASACNRVGPTTTRFITKALGKRKHEQGVIR